MLTVVVITDVASCLTVSETKTNITRLHTKGARKCHSLSLP